MRRVVVSLFALIALVAAPAVASTITVTDLVDWTGSTNSSGVTYQTFTEAAPPEWTHFVSFVPPAASFESAEIELSFGGTRTGSQEVWLLYDGSTAVLLGQLNNTSNNSANTIVQQLFSVPLDLLPSFPAGSWTVMLTLDENTSMNNSLFMDYSRLTVKYYEAVLGGEEETEAIATPEPASLLLFGAGLAGLAAHRRRRARSE